MAQHSALFAKTAYEMTTSANKEKRINDINKTIAKTGFSANRAKSNRDMIYLENGKGQTHIAVRGTNIKKQLKQQDIETDLLFAFGAEKHNKHFNKKVNRLTKLVKQTPQENKITISSHSLGSAVVNEAMKSKKLVRERVSKVHNFNPAVSPFTKKPSKEVEKELKDKITNHRIAGDVVSVSNVINKPVGTTKTYKPKELKYISKVPEALQPVFNTVEQLKIHSIDNFINKE